MKIRIGNTSALKYFTIMGERCSGTHFLQFTISKNFDLQYNKHGIDKHFFGHRGILSHEEQLETIVFMIVREPISWVDSMYVWHYHVPEENLTSIRKFLTSEWKSVNNFKNEDGSEIMEDRNLQDSRRRYSSIFEMRKIKYEYLLNDLFPQLENVVFITYEELCHKYQDVLKKIHRDFNLTKLNDMIDEFIPVPYYKGDYNEIFHKKPLQLSILDRFHILSNIDYEQEEGQFGYILPKHRVIVTGASGLVGSAIKNIVKDTDDQYLFLSSKDCDLRNEKDTFDLFNYTKPTKVIHLAYNCGGLYKNMEKSITMFEDNMKININILMASYKNNVGFLMGCLSTCIFPDQTTYPFDEESLHNGPPHDSNKGYAYCKRMFEIHCKLYQENHKLNYFCMTPTNLFGFNDNFNLEDAHVIPGLIHKAYNASRSGEYKLEVKGTGIAKRQFLFARDFAKIILHFVENDISMVEKGYSHVIVAPSEEYSISQVAEYIAQQFHLKVKYDSSYSDGQLQKYASNNRLFSLLNINSDYFTVFEEALKETIEWFKNSIHKKRVRL